MARYVNDVKTSKATEAVKEIEAYLQKEGFKQTSTAGESYWKKGLGLMIGPQFVKVEAGEDAVHIEAWIKFALLPGVYLGEQGIEGFFGVIPKKKLKSRIQAIESLVQK